MELRELPSGLLIKAGPGFCCSKAREDNMGNCYLGGCDVSAVDGMSLIPGELIQIELKNAIPASQFWIDSAHNGDQIDFIGNE